MESQLNGTPVCSSMNFHISSISFMQYFLTSGSSNCIGMGSAKRGLLANQSCSVEVETEASQASLQVMTIGEESGTSSSTNRPDSAWHIGHGSPGRPMDCTASM